MSVIQEEGCDSVIRRAGTLVDSLTVVKHEIEDAMKPDRAIDVGSPKPLPPSLKESLN